MINVQYDIILFDGICNLCNGFVKFIIRYDQKEHFKMASLQSEIGQKLLSEYAINNTDNQSVVFITSNSVYLQSDAALNILKNLGYPWKLGFVLILIPRFIRDAVYRFIARNRYRFLGKRNECIIPDERMKKRFL